jgi:F-type H+-transporting ATPase subunit delta
MANPSRSVARVYAAALTEHGRETKSLGTIHDDLKKVLALYEGDRWFRSFFTSPRIDRPVKWKALQKAFTGKVGRPVLGLLKVLVDKGREPVFDNIVDEFEKLRDQAENRVHAYVVVSQPLADELRAAITARLERSSGKNVALHERVDPEVLGGASIRVGDRVIDRTLRTRLAALKKEMLRN